VLAQDRAALQDAGVIGLDALGEVLAAAADVRSIISVFLGEPADGGSVRVGDAQVTTRDDQGLVRDASRGRIDVVGGDLVVVGHRSRPVGDTSRKTPMAR